MLRLEKKLAHHDIKVLSKVPTFSLKVSLHFKHCTVAAFDALSQQIEPCCQWVHAGSPLSFILPLRDYSLFSVTIHFFCVCVCACVCSGFISYQLCSLENQNNELKEAKMLCGVEGDYRVGDNALCVGALSPSSCIMCHFALEIVT